MDGVLSPKRRSDIEIVYEILDICSIDGMTQANIKSRVRLSSAQAVRTLERLSENGLIRREVNGYFHLTTPGHDLLKRLTRPIRTIKRVDQLLEKGANRAAGASLEAGNRPTGFKDDSNMLTVSQVARRLNVHPHSVRRWGDAGLLKSYRFGVRGDRRFTSEDVDVFMQSHKKRRGRATNLG